jgi:dsRNA-specific ribonuclease
VLGLVVADALFRTYPDFNEGQKSKVKAAVVSTQSLARHAEHIRLGDHLILGRGEEKTGGRFKQALLADAYEALIAAVYLDGGLEAASAFLLRELGDAIEAGGTPHATRDFKSALQERLQALGKPLPEYRVSGRGGSRSSQDVHGRSRRRRAGARRRDGEGEEGSGAGSGTGSPRESGKVEKWKSGKVSGKCYGRFIKNVVVP